MRATPPNIILLHLISHFNVTPPSPDFLRIPSKILRTVSNILRTPSKIQLSSSQTSFLGAPKGSCSIHRNPPVIEIGLSTIHRNPVVIVAKAIARPPPPRGAEQGSSQGIYLPFQVNTGQLFRPFGYPVIRDIFFVTKPFQNAVSSSYNGAGSPVFI